MTPAEKLYMHAVDVADRMLSEGLPVLGVQATPDASHFSVRFDQRAPAKPFNISFPADTGILQAVAEAKQRLAVPA